MEQHQFVQGTNVPNPAFQQAANTPLPPLPAVQQFWTLEENNILQEHLNFYHHMIEIIRIAQISGLID